MIGLKMNADKDESMAFKDGDISQPMTQAESNHPRITTLSLHN
jgi:hypothetical protein